MRLHLKSVVFWMVMHCFKKAEDSPCCACNYRIWGSRFYAPSQEAAG